MSGFDDLTLKFFFFFSILSSEHAGSIITSGPRLLPFSLAKNLAIADDWQYTFSSSPVFTVNTGIAFIGISMEKHMSSIVRVSIPVFGVSDQVKHKPGCAVTDAS